MRKILRNLTSRPGVIGFIIKLVRFTRTKGVIGGFRWAWDSHGFDIWHRVDTFHVSAQSEFWEQGIESTINKRNAVDSQSDSVFRIKKALETVGNFCEFQETTFLDLGCGKGRAMMVAYRYQFKEIIGVELSINVANICKNNMQKRKQKWMVISGSMTDIDWSSHLGKKINC